VANVKKNISKKFDIKEMLMYKMAINNVLTKKKIIRRNKMKKLIAIIAILALATTVFATESDPSATVGFVKYGCVITGGTDFNFVAIPMDAGYTMASDLGNAIGVCNAVAEWDPTGQGWGQQANYLNPPGIWLGDFALESGHAYMINVTAAVDVYIAGDLPADPVFNLVTTTGTDFNFIMVPLSMSAFNMAGLLGDDIGVCNSVADWDPTGQGWGQQANYLNPPGMWIGDFAIDIGQPLMVNVTANTTWPTADKAGNVKPVNVENNINQLRIKAIRR